jgi:SseB protein N-terminal domain
VDEARFEGVRVPDPGFPDDTGEVDPRLRHALTAYAAAPDDVAAYAAALTALAGSRLLVPVVAVLGEVEVDEQGLAHDKSSDMAAVLLTGRDGRRALLAFTGVEPMGRWRPDARPVPVTPRDAARAAVAEGAAALVVDVAGPVTLAVEGHPLRVLAGDQAADLR